MEPSLNTNREDNSPASSPKGKGAFKGKGKCSWKGESAAESQKGKGKSQKGAKGKLEGKGKGKYGGSTEGAGQEKRPAPDSESWSTPQRNPQARRLSGSPTTTPSGLCNSMQALACVLMLCGPLYMLQELMPRLRLRLCVEVIQASRR